MESCRETAFCLTVWYAFLTALVAVLVIVLKDLDGPTALLAAANIALLFALTLMARAGQLTERSVTRGQFWRALPPRQRPAGEAGLRLARRALEETWLTFAKAAAMIAILLSGFAYASNGVTAGAWANAARKPAVAQMQAGAELGYRSARPPIN